MFYYTFRVISNFNHLKHTYILYPKIQLPSLKINYSFILIILKYIMHYWVYKFVSLLQRRCFINYLTIISIHICTHMLFHFYISVFTFFSYFFIYWTSGVLKFIFRIYRIWIMIIHRKKQNKKPVLFFEAWKRQIIVSNFPRTEILWVLPEIKNYSSTIIKKNNQIQ